MITLISINDVKSGLVTKIKSLVSVTDLLASVDEVRESQWQGTSFEYPNVRISLDTISPIAICNTSTGLAYLQVFSEDASSREANSISCELQDELHNKSFVSGPVRFNTIVTGVVPAIRVDERTWRSEVILKLILSPA